MYKIARNISIVSVIVWFLISIRRISQTLTETQLELIRAGEFIATAVFLCAFVVAMFDLVYRKKNQELTWSIPNIIFGLLTVVVVLAILDEVL